MPGPLEWLESIGAILDELGVRWALIGALAANEYRVEPRFTTDLDAMAEPHPRLGEVLVAAGYNVTVTAEPGEPPHLLRANRGEETIDILFPVVDYQRTALARAVDHLITAEDVVVHKLIAWRHRDRADIRSILQSQERLDREYIAHWAAEWGVSDQWAEACTWAPEPDAP